MPERTDTPLSTDVAVKSENQKLLSKLQELRDFVEARSRENVLHLNTNLDITVIGEDGQIKDHREIRNLIATAGKNKLLAVSGGEALTAFTYVAIGTGTTAAAITDTALQTEVARSPTQTPTNPTAAQYQVQYTFPAGTGTGAITEAGLLDAASVGNLLARQVFGVVTKGASDTLQLSWVIS